MGRLNRRVRIARRIVRTVALASGVLCLAAPVHADEDLLEMSLEDLMNIEVTSVSKKAQNKNDTAASIHVITSEDIRRGGFTSVPEALRVVPGVQVSRIDASRWAISIRGFRQEFSNKLLVMIDGRTVYTPLFGGVVWGEQNVVMEDIDRIEVIRGPGGAVWGANAVNGVINIITKHSGETTGGLASLYGGNREYGLMGRYGGAIGDETTYRISAAAEKTEDYDFNQNYNGNDEWGRLRIGFRSDTQLDESSELTILADYFDLDTTGGVGINGGPPFFPVIGFSDNHFRHRGGDIHVKYARELEGGSEIEVKAYYDLVDRRSSIDERSHTANISGQHEVSLTDDLGLVWGADYRYWTTHTNAITPSVDFDSNDEDYHLGGGFAQLQLDLLDGKLSLIAGAKLSGNSWSGFEYQPSGRFVFEPAEGHTIWGAISRAVRTPTHADNDLAAQIGPVAINGDNDFNSEELLSFELGYRFYQLDWLTAEVSAFFSKYDDVSGLVGPPPVGPFVFANPGEVDVGGGELEIGLLPTDWWRITAGYSVMFFDEDGPPNPLDSSKLKNTHPRHQITLRSVFDLPADLEFDAALFYVDGLPDVTPTLRSNNVTQYVRLDLRLGWKPLDWLEVSLIGQNLTDARHPEFNDVQRNESTQMPRSGYARVTVDF